VRTARAANDVFSAFLKLGEAERVAFFTRLMMWTDLNLPDGTFMVVTKDQYRQATQGFMIPEIPELYEVAKQVMHSFGLPYTHPVTGKKFPPPRKRKK
jgi:hypothetical protein